MLKHLSQRPERFTVNKNSPCFGEAKLLALGGGEFFGSSVFPDRSGHAGHGVITVASTDTVENAWEWDSDLRRECFNFSDNRYASISKSAAIANVGPITISFWVNSSSGGVKWIVGAFSTTPPYSGYGVGLGVSREDKITFWGGGLPVTAVSTLGAVWTHVGVVSNGSIATFFNNGIIDGSSSVGTSALYKGPVAIGSRSGGVLGNPGQISDMMIFSGYHPEYIPFFADPANYDLRIGTVPLLQSVRSYFPSATVITSDEPGGGSEGEITAVNTYSHNSFLEAIGTYINTCGIATPGYNLFYDEMPADPIDCLIVAGTGGPRIVGNPVRFREFQVLIRGTNAQTVRHITAEIYNAFDDKWSDFSNRRIPGYCGRVYPLHEPGPNSSDENNNSVYSLNFRFNAMR